MAQSQDVVIPNRQSQLERSSWKASAIRKGDLKISGPLPYNGDLNKHASQLYTDPSPSKRASELDQRPYTVNVATNKRISSALSSNPVYSSDDVDVNAEAPRHEAQPRPQTSSIGGSHFSDKHRSTAPDVSQAVDVTSHRRSATATAADMEPRKRKSGFKGVLRRMFSKRSKPTEPKRNISTKHTYSQSDPGVLVTPKTAKRTTVIDEPTSISAATKESSLEPIEELHPNRPVGNQLPFPMNVNAPEIDPPRSTFEVSEVKRRRASLPSTVLNSAEVRALAAVWEGTGREVTTDDEEAFSAAPTHTDIGVAVSSPTADTPRKTHRRSQSAGALRELARQQSETMPFPVSGTPRRRSQEIRYWRSSIADKTVTSDSDKAGDIALQHVESLRAGDETGAQAEAQAMDVPADNAKATESDRMHGFNFGDLKSSAPDQTANSQIIPHQSELPPKTDLAQRTNECNGESIEQIPSIPLPQTVILDEAPKVRATSRQRSSSTVRENFSRPTSIKNVARGSQTPRSHDPSPIEGPTSAADIVRFNRTEEPIPVRTETPPPLPLLSAKRVTAKSSHESTKSIPYTLPTNDCDTRFQAVHIILNDERQKRKVLETQVQSLQQEVRSLQHLISRLTLQGNISYPTPSPDQVPSDRRRHARHISEDEDLDHTEYGRRNLGHSEMPRPDTVTSRFSKFDTDDEDATDPDGGRDRSDTDASNLASPEVWETPLEESVEFGFNRGNGYQRGDSRQKMCSPPLTGEDEMF